MTVAGSALEFKSEHPFHYWVRVVCFVFSIVFIGLWVVDHVDATTVSVFNVTDGYDSEAAWNLEGAHTQDDYTVISYCNEDMDLMLAYRRPGDSWSHLEIKAFDYAGGSGWKTGGVMVTSNNSILVYASHNPGSQSACILIKYGDKNWTDEWDYNVISTGARCVAYNCDINNSDVVCAIGRDAGVLVIGLWDFETETTLEGMATWYSGTNPFGDVAANYSGVFWIAYGRQGANSYVRDYYQTESAQLFASSYPSYSVDMVCTYSDRLVVSWFYSYGSVQKYPRLSIQNAARTGFTQITLDTTTSQAWSYVSAISVAQNTSHTYVYFYQGTDDEIIMWNGDIDDDQSAWQGTRQVMFADTDTHVFLGGFSRVWPRFVSNTTSVSQPTTGWVVCMKESTADPHEYYSLFMSDDINWTGDLTYTPPGGPGPGDGGDEGGNPASGICNSAYIAVMILVVILIGFVGVFADKML